jgi:hypothetical protein
MSREEPTFEEMNETWKWWIQINGGDSYALKIKDPEKELNLVKEYIKQYGLQKPKEQA